MAIDATHYVSKAFQSGALPLAVLKGAFQLGVAAQHAREDVAQATVRLEKEGRIMTPLPSGYALKAADFSPKERPVI